MKKEKTVGPVTLRNLPEEIAFLVRKTSIDKKISLNRAVISLLEERAGIEQRTKPKTLHHDLDFLSGTWSEKEARMFDKALRFQRSIDPDLWK